MIEKVGSRWVLFSHKGKILGQHRTKREAQAQEHAINISKARRAGHWIPQPYRK